MQDGTYLQSDNLDDAKAHLSIPKEHISPRLSGIHKDYPFLDHQIIRVDRILRTYKDVRFSSHPLYNDIRLGKTFTAIAFLLHLKNNGLLKRPILIIAPPDIVVQWADEIEAITLLKAHFETGILRLQKLILSPPKCHDFFKFTSAIFGDNANVVTADDLNMILKLDDERRHLELRILFSLK
ncbi:hypothetical protein BGW36DRAFT_431513 [Talaromyces proteolyticus]|uniref:SNF2 N-terminal domain-containing protein n=1 Tax=Talaromyces proteolyticus TaxID=1131652 RepID=A0AAD4PWU5_9EURO|nr:uncharacterized protein BGW36DRAFT_431513 [Talaromyces proteolyticus]KAH8692292.1 hypothetical protein BGW36DRAFT_431513 [Talaromyces proteolyticus]